MIITVNGQTWGDGDGDINVLEAPGLEDIARASTALTGGGTDGGVRTAQFAQPGAPVIKLAVLADSDEDMDDRLRALYSATWGGTDRLGVIPLDFTPKGASDPTTLFVRITNRSVPTDFTTADRYRACQIVLAYETPDPMAYCPEVNVATLSPGDSLAVAGGWAPSQRWRWIAHGAVTNPRLLVETPGFPDQILRLVGTVNSGQNLLVESSPDELVTTVGGFARLDDFDGGDSDTMPRWFEVLPGQTITYDVGAGSGTASFRYRTARP